MKKIIEMDFKGFFSGLGRKKEYIADLITIKARNLTGYLYINRFTIKLKIAPDPEYGIVKTKFRTSYFGEYKISLGDGRDFDTLLMLGLNRDKEIIEKVYAIPKKEIGENRFMTITKTGKGYEEFRIDANPYNKIYHDMKAGIYSIFEDGSIAIVRGEKFKKSQMGF